LGEAEGVMREAMELPGSSIYAKAVLGYVLAREGEEAKARALLDALEAEAAGGYVSPVAFSTLYLGLHDLDRAMDWLERACDERRGWLAYLRVNALFDPLRGTPRFETLLKRMNL
jgi:hypothetical protein